MKQTEHNVNEGHSVPICTAFSVRVVLSPILMEKLVHRASVSQEDGWVAHGAAMSQAGEEDRVQGIVLFYHEEKRELARE